VLDVGCGTGTLALAIRPLVGDGEVHGIDASPEMIEVAKEKSAQGSADVEGVPTRHASFVFIRAYRRGSADQSR
jgi:ubiquinone/menaquinone biosynthesis C-methylase UbiE